MNKNPIKNSVEGIVFSEEAKNHILSGIGEKRVDQRKKPAIKWRVRIAVCIVIVFSITSVMLMMNSHDTEITVYAMTQEAVDKNAALFLEKQVNLKPMETPVGYGYVFEVEIPNNYLYKCKPMDGNNSIFTVYQNGKYIYWIPNQEMPGKIYNSSNKELNVGEYPSINKCEFEIIFYSNNKAELDRRKVEFRITEDACAVTLKK